MDDSTLAARAATGDQAAFTLLIERYRRYIYTIAYKIALNEDDALDELTRRHPALDLVFLESGGDNLAASFSPELVDAAIYVIDVSGGVLGQEFLELQAR